MSATAQMQSSNKPGDATRSRTAGPAVYVGASHALEQQDVEESARRAGVTATFCWDMEQARELLASPDEPIPRSVVVDARMEGLESFIAWMRGEARLFPVPVVVQVATPSDEAYLRAHSLGADDVVPGPDISATTRRLANLAEFDPTQRPPLTQGAAVVAHPDELRRRVLGRILRQAGFDVSFAVTAEDLVRVAEGQAETPALLIADAGLPPGGALQAVSRLRERAGATDLPVVITAPDEQVAPLRETAQSMGSTAVTSETGPPDNLLFLANELLRPDVRDIRASTRLLYGTICAFREAGTLTPVYGLTYNISREGLYVRSLDPPTPGSLIWIEMRPPHADAAVHLRAKAVWARGLRSPGGAAPPGFGVRLIEEASPAEDWSLYEAGYQRLRAATEAG